MRKTEDRSKSKEERLKEKEKVDAETQRSHAVAEMKKAHKLIEDTEKMRKRPILQSICLRIDTYIKFLGYLIDLYGKFPFADRKILSDNVMDGIGNFYQTYESIRFDFQKNMEIRDEDMNSLFPKIKMKTTTGHTVVTSFAGIRNQVLHMKLYCNRMFA